MSTPTYCYAAAIAKIRLTAAADRELSHHAYTRTTTWLDQWTPGNNYKAVLGADLDECVNKLRATLQRELVPTSSWLTHCGVEPKHFEFAINDTEVSEDGHFWASLSKRLGDYHKVVQEVPQ